MRTIEIKGTVIGNGIPKICMPLVGHTEREMLSDADEAVLLKPDLVEVRADYYENISALAGLLGKIRKKLPHTPLLFTLRDASEGGASGLCSKMRFEIIQGALETGLIDIVDIELVSAKNDLFHLIDMAKHRGIAVILSSHFFASTPPRHAMLEILRSEKALGADIAKLAVTPGSPFDVLELLWATEEARDLGIPLITASMGCLGLASRIIGGVFGSSVTFGTGSKRSAPEQPHINELRTVLDLLYLKQPL